MSEGLQALTHLTSLDRSLLSPILTAGAWSNCIEVLGGKNMIIITMAVELMANLSLSEEVVRYTKLSSEVDLLSALFLEHCLSDLPPDSQQYKLAYGITSWFANLTQSFQVVKDTLAKKPALITGLLRLLNLNLDSNLAHRLLSILDDVKEDVKLRKHIPSNLSTSDI